MSRNRLFVVALSALLVASCQIENTGPLGQIHRNIVSSNGVSLNGISLNGVSLNGVSLNGVSLNGVSLNGVSLNGVSLNGVSLNGTELAGTTAQGIYLQGADLVGVVLQGLLSNGDKLLLRVDSVQPGEGADSDILYHAVSFQTATGWEPLCGTLGDGSPQLAIIMAGTWDHRQGVEGGGAWNRGPDFTFACRGAAVAKCAEMGYKPWATVTKCQDVTTCKGKKNCTTTTYCTDYSLTDYHASCVRAIRADYCGDGTPWTVNGRLINLYDDGFFGLATDTKSWVKEAEWTGAGAACQSRSRAGDPNAVQPCELPVCTNKWMAGFIVTEYGEQ